MFLWSHNSMEKSFQKPWCWNLHFSPGIFPVSILLEGEIDSCPLSSLSPHSPLSSVGNSNSEGNFDFFLWGLRAQFLLRGVRLRIIILACDSTGKALLPKGYFQTVLVKDTTWSLISLPVIKHFIFPFVFLLGLFLISLLLRNWRKWYVEHLKSPTAQNKESVFPWRVTEAAKMEEAT